jgi:CRISPR-associated protein (TIGR02584 family)
MTIQALAPHQFNRRILLAVTGMSPQIVTETLYALCKTEQPAFVPTEIHILSTQEGIKRARLTLQEADTGHFHRMCAEHGLSGIKFDESCLHVIHDAAGEPLSDIQTPEQNALAADQIAAFVRGFTADVDSALHVSIAGGRKSMGFFMGYAMSLFGRVQDRLSHVLVSSDFENMPDFYFPPVKPVVLYTRDKKPVHTSEAQVMLAEIPFVRLRNGLPSNLLSGDSSFSETVETAQRHLSNPVLTIDIASRKVFCLDTQVKLEPQLFAWLRWLAEARKNGQGDDGFFERQNWDKEGFLRIYRLTNGGASSDTTEQILRSEGNDATSDCLKFFDEKSSNVNSALKKALGAASSPYKIVSKGKKPGIKKGLSLPPGAIRIVDGNAHSESGVNSANKKTST